MSTNKKHYCSVTLIVVGEDLDPEVVSDALGMKPFQSWRRYERKSVTLPDGRVMLFDSVHDEGGWKKLIPQEFKEDPLFEQIIYWRDRLHELRGAIWNMRERGWVAELLCYVGSAHALLLPNDEIRELADLGVDLGLDVWGTGTEPEEEISGRSSERPEI